MAFHDAELGESNHAITANPNPDGTSYADIAARDADNDFTSKAKNINKVVRVESPLGLSWLTDALGNYRDFLFPDSESLDVSCRVTMSAPQVVSNATDVLITWNQESYDTDDMHDNMTNNSRITVQVAGKYSVMAQASWADNSVGMRELSILKNSVVVGVVRHLADGNAQHVVSFVDECAVGDFLELSVNQDSGGNLAFQSATYFEAHKIN